MKKKCMKNKKSSKRSFNPQRKLFIHSIPIILSPTTPALSVFVKILCLNCKIWLNFPENLIQGKCCLAFSQLTMLGSKQSQNNSPLITLFGQSFIGGIPIQINGWITLLIRQMRMLLKNLWKKVQGPQFKPIEVSNKKV